MNKQFKIYNNLYNVNERKQLIADTLRALRLSQKLSQKEIAEYIDVNTQTYGAYESGRNEPPAEVLVRLSLFYDVPVDVIVQRDNMSKDVLTQKKQIENYEEQIDELKVLLLEQDPVVQQQIKLIIEQMEGMTNAIKDVTEKQQKQPNAIKPK